MAAKKCSKCGVEKGIEAFYYNVKRDYRNCKCKHCVSLEARAIRAKPGYSQWHKQYRRSNKTRLNALTRASRAKAPEKARSYNRTWRTKDPIRALYFAAKQRAKKYGIAFAIGRDDILMPPRCPILGIPFGPNTGRGMGSHGDSPSLDRIEPLLGYVSGNVQVISRKANTMKSNASRAELEAFADWVLRRKYGKAAA